MNDAPSQAEADALLAMEKHRATEDVYEYPQPGEKIVVPLISADKREEFLLDVYRGRIVLARGTYQNRGRKVVTLARLDFGGAPHTNPDGRAVGVPHLHLYREGYGDKWAYPLPDDRFGDPDDRWRLFEEFMAYCNVTRVPNIPPRLFT